MYHHDQREAYVLIKEFSGEGGGGGGGGLSIMPVTFPAIFMHLGFLF